MFGIILFQRGAMTSEKTRKGFSDSAVGTLMTARSRQGIEVLEKRLPKRKEPHEAELEHVTLNLKVRITSHKTNFQDIGHAHRRQ